MKYLVTLRTGETFDVCSYREDSNMIRLWRWALKQALPQTLSFIDCDFLATEIACIRKVK